MNDNTRHPRRHTHPKIEAMAERGTRRGVDDVLEAAMRQAGAVLDGAGQEFTMSDQIPTSGEPLAALDPSGGTVPAIDMQPRRARPSRRNRGVAGLGIAALLGVGGYAAFAAQGDGGGASSPQAAVEQLADAISNEDALAAVDVLAPDEVRSLQRSIETAADKAEQFDLVEDSAHPFRGIDLDVNDLTTEVETLSEGFAKVTITGGVIDSAVDPTRFAPRIRDRLLGEETTSDQVDLAEFDALAGGLFAIAVQDGDGWYVSPAYTALEYARISQEGAPAQLGSADAAQLGAESPEAAVRDALDAVRTSNWERLLELAPPSELPVWEYRDFLIGQMEEAEPNFTVDRLDLTSNVDGDTAVVTIDGEGSYSDGEGTWRVAADCPSTGLLTASSDDVDSGQPDLCLNGALAGWLFFVPSAGSDTAAQVTVVEEGGRWFVSPVGTVLDVVDDWVNAVDERTIATLTNDYSALEPEGAITLGDPVAVAADSVFSPLVYTFEGEAGMEIVGQADPEYSASAAIFGPDGAELDDGWGLASGYPASLVVDGTYTIVLRGDFNAGTFTLWTVDDAPTGVVQDDFGGGFEGGEVCEFQDDGSQICYSTDATMAVPTTMAVVGE